MLITQLADGVPIWRNISLLSQKGKAETILHVAKWMTKQISTHDFLALFDSGIDFGDVTLGFIVNLVDFILAENLQSLSGG